MDKINQAFHDLMFLKNFQMKATEKEDHWLYEGKLSVKEEHTIDFAVSISKGVKTAIGQIVFRNIASFDPERGNRSSFLELINDLNVTNGAYYYYCLDRDNRVFIRYVSEVNSDIEPFFDILVVGPSLIKTTIDRF
ncbi:hypothetical protein ACMZ5S_10235 [Streptococcus pluranimalium]